MKGQGPQGELRSARRQHCPVPCITCGRVQAIPLTEPSVLSKWMQPCAWCAPARVSA